MSEAKYTPAPWAKTTRLGEGHDTHWYVHHKSEGAHGGYFAKVEVLHKTAEAIATGEANVRLIAAAPDLLEACKAMVATFHDHPDRDESSLSLARAAIAKTEDGLQTVIGLRLQDRSFGLRWYLCRDVIDKSGTIQSTVDLDYFGPRSLDLARERAIAQGHFEGRTVFMYDSGSRIALYEP